MILQSYAFQKYTLILYVTKYNVIMILNLEIILRWSETKKFSFRIFFQDFQEFESSYLWNGSRY